MGEAHKCRLWERNTRRKAKGSDNQKRQRERWRGVGIQTNSFFLKSSRIKRLEAEESSQREWMLPAWLAVIATVAVYLACFRGIPLHACIPS